MNKVISILVILFIVSQLCNCIDDADVSLVESSTNLESVQSSFMTEDIRISPAKKTKKKTKKKKKKKRTRHQRIRKRYMKTSKPKQYTDISNYIETTTITTIALEPIYDRTTGVSYTPEQLDALCRQTRTIGNTFGIQDIRHFAGSNCPLILLYYPNVTCEQISQFMEYCEKSPLFQINI